MSEIKKAAATTAAQSKPRKELIYLYVDVNKNGEKNQLRTVGSMETREPIRLAADGESSKYYSSHGVEYPITRQTVPIRSDSNMEKLLLMERRADDVLLSEWKRTEAKREESTRKRDRWFEQANKRYSSKTIAAIISMSIALVMAGLWLPKELLRRGYFAIGGEWLAIIGIAVLTYQLIKRCLYGK